MTNQPTHEELKQIIKGLEKEVIEYKRSEAILKDSQMELSAILSSAPLIMMVVDQNRQVRQVSNALKQFTGRREEELLGKRGGEALRCIHRLDDPKGCGYGPACETCQVRRVVLDTFKTGDCYHQIEAKLSFEGDKVEERVLLVSTALLDTPEKMVLVCIEDITERKQAEEALQRAHAELEMRVEERTAELAKANKELRTEIMERKKVETALLKAKGAAEAASRAKSEFLATMSHELRTPLNSVIGFSEILASQTFGKLNERQAKYANDTLRGGQRLLGLVNDILDLAEVGAGKTELKLSEFDASGAIHSVLKSVRRLAVKKNIALKIEIEESLPLITADKARFKQIFYNLISNAVKFTPEGGSITLSARHLSFVNGHLQTRDGQKISLPMTNNQELMTHRNLLEISVSDTGIGIKPEDQERIFHTFEQIDPSYSRKQGGTGLGLALTRKLVELYGGRIWVESEGIGKGSRFSFILPESTTD